MIPAISGTDSPYSTYQLTKAPGLGQFRAVTVTPFLMNLRQPPANVAVQIVLWDSDHYLKPSVVNALGLGLRIDPRFFGSSL